MLLKRLRKMTEKPLDLGDRIRKEMVLSAEEEAELLRKERDILWKKLCQKSKFIDNIIKEHCKRIRKQLKKQLHSITPKEYKNFLKRYNADREYIDGAIDGFEECRRIVIKVIDSTFSKENE